MEKLRELLVKYSADWAILQSKDKFTRLHYENSQLTRYTGFTGTAGEAVIDAEGKIILFVDPRYHIQADVEAKTGIGIVKFGLSERFTEILKNHIKEGSVLLVDEERVSVKTFEKLKEHFEVKCVKFPDIIEAPSKSAPKELPLEFCGEDSSSKIAKVQDFIMRQNADGYLISKLEDIAWITNSRSYEIPYSSAFKAQIYVDKDGIHDYPCAVGKKVIINPEFTSMADFLKLQEPVTLKDNFIAKLASVKNDAEISCLKDGFSRLDRALENFRAQIKDGLTEYELKNIIEKEIFSQGAQALSFKTILAIGENSSSIHYTQSDPKKRLKDGDIILLDCGAYFEGGLATDITRTFVSGTPSDEQKTVYTRVLQAFLRAYNSDLPTGFELDELARNFLKEHALNGFGFSHGLGHGIGVSVHQLPPVISSADKTKEKLVPRNTFTIEPGLYCEGKFGVRLENTVYINDEGKKVSFSSCPFERALIDFELLNEDEKQWLTPWIE